MFGSLQFQQVPVNSAAPFYRCLCLLAADQPAPTVQAASRCVRKIYLALDSQLCVITGQRLIKCTSLHERREYTNLITHCYEMCAGQPCSDKQGLHSTKICLHKKIICNKWMQLSCCNISLTVVQVWPRDSKTSQQKRTVYCSNVRI